MSNPFNTMNPMNPMNNMNMGAIQNAYQMLMSSKNPMQLFQNMAQNNPQLQPILQMLRNGGNPQQIFMNMCHQKGIDPQQFLTSITGKNTF